MSNSTSQRSFMDAINERYGAEDDSNSYSEDAFDVGSTRSAKKNNKKWEMVGMDMARQKQSNHARLSVLGLQDCNISYAEKVPEQIAKAGLKRVRELNLSDNGNLSAVCIDKIVSALPNLVELQLSGTGVGNVSCWSPLASQQDLTSGTFGSTTSADDVVSSPSAGTSPTTLRPASPFVHNNTWSRLTTLALNRCNMSWDNLLEAFPCNLVSLVSLHLESNGIDKIYPPAIRRTPAQQHAAVTNGTQSTTTAATGETSTSSSSFIPMFPALKELNLSFNQLTTLDEDEQMIQFLELDAPKLTSLNLTGNMIAISKKKDGTTSSVNSDYLSRLEVLYLTQNPPLVAKNYSHRNETEDMIKEEPLAALEYLRTHCPKIKSLRVTYQDVFGYPQQQESSATTIPRPKSSLSEVQQRSLVIAAMSQIETLNSGPVRAKERLDAEMSYLQVARAKKEQAENSTGTTTISTSATNRFFPWKEFPLLDYLAEKHKNVILTSLNADGKSNTTAGGNAGLATGSALAYTLKLTFKVLSEQTKESKSELDPSKVIRTTSKIPMAEDVSRTVPGNMTVGKLRSFVASIYPSVASIASQKRIQAFAEDNGGSAAAVVLEVVDDENPLILCGVPSSAVIEVFV